MPGQSISSFKIGAQSEKSLNPEKSLKNTPPKIRISPSPRKILRSLQWCHRFFDVTYSFQTYRNITNTQTHTHAIEIIGMILPA